MTSICGQYLFSVLNLEVYTGRGGAEAWAPDLLTRVEDMPE
jgi:hypothetical protein